MIELKKQNKQNPKPSNQQAKQKTQEFYSLNKKENVHTWTQNSVTMWNLLLN